MSAWKVGPVTLKCASAEGPYDVVVAGWVNGPFGMDFRTFRNTLNDYCLPGFCLTHMPTGYQVRQLVDVGTEQAMDLANEILASADWSFTGSPTEEHKLATKAAMDKHPGFVTSGHRSIGPSA